MAAASTSSGDTIVRSLAALVIALVLGAASFAVWIGLENIRRIGV